MGDRWWTHADGGDAPWQMLAFCFEWAAYVESGEGEDFESFLPIAVDGTCNGLQHYSAMLRDPVGAKVTNLADMSAASDIYTIVADRTVELVQAKLQESATDREMAGKWLARGIGRSTVKRGVMTTPYGSTEKGIATAINNDTVKADPKFDWGDQKKNAGMWLAKVLVEAIGDTVSSANEAMGFLKQVAKVANGKKEGIAWVTPAGLPVTQLKLRMKSSIIPTQLLGRLRLAFSQETDKIHAGDQIKGISPNFVHSLDAAHLMLTVCALEDEQGPNSWAMVHDSYATHAGCTEDLSRVLRRVFIDMYKDTCPLTSLLNSVVGTTELKEVPEVPVQGTFNLEEVMDADFFFS